MKKLLLASAALFLIVTASCDFGRKERERQDSIRIADSIHHAELARLDSIRQDSIRQDSIQRAELDEALRIMTFVKWFNEGGDWGKGLELRSDSQITASLVNLGFEVNKNTRTRREEICGEYTTWQSKIYRYTKTIGDETVEIKYEDNLEITFPNEEMRRNFVTSAMGVGYHKEQGYSEIHGTFYAGPSDCYYRGSDMIVQGNKVFITPRFEC